LPGPGGAKISVPDAAGMRAGTKGERCKKNTTPEAQRGRPNR
jgi:hypothetical protein